MASNNELLSSLHVLREAREHGRKITAIAETSLPLSAAPAASLAGVKRARSTEASPRANPSSLENASTWRHRDHRAPPRRGRGNMLVKHALGISRIAWPEKKPGELWLCSYNVRSFKPLVSRGGFDNLFGLCDVVALQETHATTSELSAMVKRVTHGSGFTVFANGNPAVKTRGVALCVKGGLASGATITHVDFAPAGGAASVVPAAVAYNAMTIRLPAAGMHVVVVHRPYECKSDPPAIKAWMLAFLAHLEALQRAPGALPVAVMGDLNTDTTEFAPRDGAPEGVWASLAPFDLADATAGTTEYAHPSHFPDTSKFRYQRLDYLMLSAPLRGRLVGGSARVLNEGAPEGDHVPVVAALRLLGARVNGAGFASGAMTAVASGGGWAAVGSGGAAST